MGSSHIIAGNENSDDQFGGEIDQRRSRGHAQRSGSRGFREDRLCQVCALDGRANDEGQQLIKALSSLNVPVFIESERYHHRRMSNIVVSTFMLVILLYRVVPL